MPTADLILKIARLAGDERGDSRIRQIAFDKLKVFRETHPHLFVLPGKASDASEAEALWSDVAEAEDKPAKPTSGPVDPRKARFMNHASWSETAKGNPSIEVTRRGVAYKVVLFEYKKSPMVGFLLINEDTDEQTFSNTRYKTYGEARQGAWEALCSM